MGWPCGDTPGGLDLHVGVHLGSGAVRLLFLIAVSGPIESSTHFSIVVFLSIPPLFVLLWALEHSSLVGRFRLAGLTEHPHHQDCLVHPWILTHFRSVLGPLMVVAVEHHPPILAEHDWRGAG